MSVAQGSAAASGSSASYLAIVRSMLAGRQGLLLSGRCSTLPEALPLVC